MILSTRRNRDTILEQPSDKGVLYGHSERSGVSYGNHINIVSHQSKSMSHYWAEFTQLGKDTFRFDTRIYIRSINSTEKSDRCVGAVVGKNPGSAKAGIIGKGIQPIELEGDKLLPTVHNIVKKAYMAAGIQTPERGYIQVLNLFYLCNPDLGKAIIALKENKCARNCSTENRSCPWIWYVWGGASEALTPYQNRLSNLIGNDHFYYDKEKSKVIAESPFATAFAKHTQGLKHDYVVPYIAGLLKNG